MRVPGRAVKVRLRKREASRPVRRRGLAMAALLSLGLLGLSDRARPQQTSSYADVLDDGPAVIAHLSSVIQFYRTVTEPVQKAGEPNDVVYRDQAIAQSIQIGALAFQSAKAEAALIDSVVGAAAPETDQQQRIQNAIANNEKRVHDLEVREKALDASQRTGRAQQEQERVHAALELENAIHDALHRIAQSTAQRGGSGLTASVTRLEQSTPELRGGNKISAPEMMTIDSALSSGVTTQSTTMVHLLETQHELKLMLAANERLQQQATDLRAPMVAIVRKLVQRGQDLSQQAEAAIPAKAGKGKPANGAPAPEDLQSITKQFKAVSAATVPLSEELNVVGQSHANLMAWQASVGDEYASILHSLLLRILVIALALAAILGAGKAWTRATNKYVRDVRRRRQLLIVRRVMVGFLSLMVVLFGFVTRFDSLATFAGFITAGIAVGLQTILLSVAAYFFIVGRYGIKVGDRITVASVTGDVIDVGLVRFYVMELAGSGSSLNPTGRVAVFSNAVLFQAGTPLYKQMPGTGYAWHELTVRLTDGTDYIAVCEAILKEVDGVFEGYRAEIDRQHHTVQEWMQATIEKPGIESRLQFIGGVIQLWVRFPVEIRDAAETDEKVTHALLRLIAENPAVKGAVKDTPSIQPSVRG